MKKYKPLGSNVVIKVTIGEQKIGSIIVAESDRESRAKEEAVIVDKGEYAFDDLSESNRPSIGDRVVIARYDGKTLENDLDNYVERTKRNYELRVIEDTRILVKVEEE